MKHGSLFSGIGGFDLASEWMGWENVFHCEIESFPRKILHHYWPNAISYEDIKKTDFTIHRGGIDILTGGFPCQPFSMAGKRKGTEDERHLWPEMLRAIREIQPRWIVGENVFGLVNWDAGLVFEQVQSDLEAEGYEVQAFILPAAAVDAPHRRDRVWFVAYSTSQRFCRDSSRKQSQYKTHRTRNGMGFKNATDSDSGRLERAKESGWDSINVKRKSDIGNAPNTNNNGQNKCDSQHEINTSQGGINALGNIEQVGEYAADTKSICIQRQRNRPRQRQFRGSNWSRFPTQSPICGRNDGISTELDGITFSKWRNESIKGYGNAIVPQVVYQIFKAIEEYESRC